MEKGNGQMKILSLTMHWTNSLANNASVDCAGSFLTHKMKNLINILVLLMAALAINAQQKIDPNMLQRNNIIEIEGYVFDSETAMDSMLITKEYFNAKGHRVKIEIYNSTGTTSEYIYNYKDDTLLTERITKFRNELHSVTKIRYDDKLREIETIDYDFEGKKMGTYSKVKYNDRKKTKETKIYIENTLYIHTMDLMDGNKFKKRLWTERNGKKIIKSECEQNKHVIEEEIINFKGSQLTMKKRTNQICKDQTILGLKGRLKISSGDILTDETYLNQNGLIEYEKQYLNDKLIGIKKYKYLP